MRNYSFFDPSLFELDYVKRMLVDVEYLIEAKTNEVNIDFEKWKRENEHERLNNEDYYYAMEDNFVNEMNFVLEFSAIILNGLAVRINTTFETHVKAFVREMEKINKSIKYNDEHTYKLKELLKYMKETQHPNVATFEKETELRDRLIRYSEIRNCIVHDEGRVKKDSVKQFITNNRTLFEKKEGMWTVSVKAEYIRQVVADLETFFKLMAYTSDGKVIYC